jgi:osmotically inducible lipoprotein OsmB
MTRIRIAAIAIFSLALAGCTTGEKRVSGAAIGGVFGAAIAGPIGAGAGAAAGAATAPSIAR